MSSSQSSPSSESFSFFEVQVNDGLAILTMNRPQALNACRLEDHSEFGRVLRAIAADEGIRAAVVTGAGRSFCVGADFSLVDAVLRNPKLVIDLQAEARELVRAHIELHKPIVAAINGPAMGAGLIFALLCDYIVADRSARMSDGHVAAGLAAGDGGALVWPLTVGLAKAKRYLLTSDWIGAEEAERIGLITEVVDDGHSLERGIEIARRFMQLPERALRFTKQAINNWLNFGEAAVFVPSLALEMENFLVDGDLIARRIGDVRRKN